jgi:hypothetical protein
VTGGQHGKVCSRLAPLELVLHDLCFNLEVAQFVAQSLCFDAELLALLFALLDLLLHQHSALDRLVELRLHVLQ